MTNGEAVNWIINISADIGKTEHRDLWHYEQALSEIREMLESAQPEQQWTPVSEGLPEKSGRYLVQYGEDSDYLQEILTYFAEDYLGIPKGWHSMDLWEPLVDHSADMIAWMPLPEPWRGEEG